MQLEAHLSEDGTERECNTPFSLITPHLHQCERLPTANKRGKRGNHSTEDQLSISRKEDRKEKRTTTSNNSNSKAQKERRKTTASEQQKESGKALQQEEDEEEEEEEEVANEDGDVDMDMDDDTASLAEGKIDGNESPEPAQMRDIKQKGVDQLEVPEEDVLVLRGHESEVFVCTWNPVNVSELASGAGDATGRLWLVPENLTDGQEEPCVLPHLPAKENVRDVTTMEWNPTGTLLATGSYDGQARIWTSQGRSVADAAPGALRHILFGHKGPIFSLKWNKKGTLLLSAGVDENVILWDVHKGEMLQQYRLHDAGVLDVDWRDDTVFASCSSDRTLQVCQVGKKEPIKSYKGHTDEVNSIRWDPTGTYLASCSDDGSAKVWTLNEDKCVQDFRHRKEIYTLRWSPNVTPRLLATASFDTTIKLWDVISGTCLRTLTGHADSVYALAFNPTGKYLASGSFDQNVHLWNVQNGKLLRKHDGGGGIFEVSWNATGTRVAAAYSNSTVVVINAHV